MKTLKVDFGLIYNGNNPTHGVYSEDALNLHGSKAVAISAHWSEDEARMAAAKSTEFRGSRCVAVKYEHNPKNPHAVALGRRGGAASAGKKKRFSEEEIARRRQRLDDARSKRWPSRRQNYVANSPQTA